MGWMSIVAVGIGAAGGAWLRWGLGAWLNPLVRSMPMGTLAANLLGGYLVGLAVGFFSHHPGLGPEARLLIVTGFLGGLTTFSTFSAESVHLLSRGEWVWALAHGFLHLAGSLALTFAGMGTINVLMRP